MYPWGAEYGVVNGRALDNHKFDDSGDSCYVDWELDCSDCHSCIFGETCEWSFTRLQLVIFDIHPLKGF